MPRELGLGLEFKTNTGQKCFVAGDFVFIKTAKNIGTLEQWNRNHRQRPDKQKNEIEHSEIRHSLVYGGRTHFEFLKSISFESFASIASFASLALKLWNNGTLEQDDASH